MSIAVGRSLIVNLVATLNHFKVDDREQHATWGVLCPLKSEIVESTLSEVDRPVFATCQRAPAR